MDKKLDRISLLDLPPFKFLDDFGGFVLSLDLGHLLESRPSLDVTDKGLKSGGHFGVVGIIPEEEQNLVKHVL